MYPASLIALQGDVNELGGPMTPPGQESRSDD